MGPENIIYSDEEENSAVSEIFEKTGLESEPINDYLYYHESEEMGGIVIKVVTDSHLEEDLAQMKKSETVLGVEAHTRIIHECFKDTLELLGRYIPSDKVERMFPGINLAAPDGYDFSTAKIKVFVLSNEDFEFFEENFYQNIETGNLAGLVTPTVRHFNDPSLSKKMNVDLSEKKIITVKEIGRYASHIAKKVSEGSSKDLTESDIEQIELNLKRVVIHEFIHSLDVSSDLPDQFNEAVTEWYTREVLNGESGDKVQLYMNNEGGMYEKLVDGMSILVNSMLEEGMHSITIDKAFLSGDPESRQELTNFLSKRYGSDEADRIMKWRFSSAAKFLDNMEWLERKHALDAGKTGK